MVEHGAVLLDSSCQLRNTSRDALNSGTLQALTAFDGNHKFIVDLFRAGAEFLLIASCCNAISTTSTTAKSISLCQAAVLAGYVPSAEEVVNLQLAAAKENTADGLLKQLMDWLNEDRQQVPSLFRQCRVAIRRQISASTQNQTILPGINQLPLPNNLKLYLQFDGQMTEVDLSINDDEQSQGSETTEETSAENSDYDNSDSDYPFGYDYDPTFDGYDSDNCCGIDCDHDLWWL